MSTGHKSKQSGGSLSKNKQKKLRQAQLSVETQNKLFNQYFLQQYSAERWNQLAQALQQPAQYVALMNTRADPTFAAKLLNIDSGLTVPFHPETFAHKVYAHSKPLAAAAPLIVGATLGDTGADEDEGGESDEELSAPKAAASDEAAEHDDDHSSLLWPSPGANLDSNGLAVYYPLDAASLFPVALLDVQPNHDVLDLCAAPGGKSLFILQHLRAPHGHLTSNDVSYDRKRRLERILRQYLPADESDLADVIHGDATSKRFPEELGGRRFDRVLVDAPCASERHLIMKSPFFASPATELRFALPLSAEPAKRDVQREAKREAKHAKSRRGGGQAKGGEVAGEEGELGTASPQPEPAAEAARAVRTITAGMLPSLGRDDFMSWAPGRSRFNAERQVSLLKTAFALCKVGGIVVYSTCSINSVENDQVVEKVLKKTSRAGRARLEVQPIDAARMPFGEPTQFGWHMLPDASHGWGPIYMCVLRKTRGEDDEDGEGSDGDEA